MMKALCTIAVATFAASASAASAVEVTKSVEVAGGPEAAWKAIGDFCGISNWHPAVAKCEPSADGSAKMRTLTLKDGAKVLEKQLSFDDKTMSYSYAIVEAGPLPVQNYTSTLAVTPNGSGSKITWSGKFDPKGDETKAAEAIGGVYQGGLDSLAAQLK